MIIKHCIQSIFQNKLSLITKFIISDFKMKEHYIRVTAMYQKQINKMEAEQKESRNLNQIVFCHRRLVSVCLQLENGNLFSLFTIMPHVIMIFIFSLSNIFNLTVSFFYRLLKSWRKNRKKQLQMRHEARSFTDENTASTMFPHLERRQAKNDNAKFTGSKENIMLSDLVIFLKFYAISLFLDYFLFYISYLYPDVLIS